ncbi:MAG: acetyl-CoA carboxylase biotin carboxyl carrier protein [Rhodospirillales bacterium]|nr:acetyl-CoA carboxylase biotin carboxyl carrier protein [Rhodospirillales bacterium]
MPNSKFSVDPELIKKLAEILNQTGLGEIEYAEGDRRVRVARPAVAAAAPAAMAPPAAGAAPASPSGPSAGTIVSPMVGTVYASPEPNAPPFVKVGDRVKEGQTLLIIEAMKVMNQIRSPRSGTVTHIHVADGAPVEYGEPLLIIE